MDSSPLKPHLLEQARLYQVSEARKRNIHAIITRGYTRHYQGEAKAHTGGEELTGYETAELSRRGITAYFWTDASWIREEGLLAAAFAAREEGVSGPGPWFSKTASLGRYVGDSSDGELYGIQMALEEGLDKIRAGNDIKNIVVYSDAKFVIELLERGRTNPLNSLKSAYLGPVPVNGEEWSLEKVYSLTEQLAARGVRVLVRWIKGHSGKRGNDLADEHAKRENYAQQQRLGEYQVYDPDSFSWKPPSRYVLGLGAPEEYVWRQSQPLYEDEERYVFLRYCHGSPPEHLFDATSQPAPPSTPPPPLSPLPPPPPPPPSPPPPSSA